ncbi:glucosamine-6-phosphate deaminase [Phnomibacter ginsenosidimutans]|uniref:Glucosamine-6-phosphate deaminase n=1 Tax=Phnomibacter ginsenosidimutans TaxID=2676868 RepID=A0A6I6G5E9_9BACT|nr:glucosamine-6-phosphate deaminase [Phnomibacter ginsenosidimutans]QGW27417.1 glucosamine-6-phosphate deaminase [Phnomibacter ginsenosidimutans]
MNIQTFESKQSLGKDAGAKTVAIIKDAIHQKGNANIILATGSSQFETLNFLIQDTTIDWSKVTMFHLDEYIGISSNHSASFRKYLTERFLSNVPQLQNVYLINGDTDATAECERLQALIKNHPIDVALVGIGENGHLAFNDPPADFETEEPFIVVALDIACRQQQMKEGWFAHIDEVPTHAISMSIKQILKSASIICSVPDARKAQAVYNTITQPVSPLYPASILRNHPNTYVYLDTESASLLPSNL